VPKHILTTHSFLLLDDLKEAKKSP
jgi:hypothetical protein